MRGSVLLAVALAAAGCKGKGSEAGATAASSSAAVAATAGPSGRPHLVRDEQGRLVPTRPPPQDNPADIPKAPAGAPGWDLDRIDPARDYVERYVRATRRYGEATACVTTKPAGSREGKALVEVRDREKPPAGCPSAGGAARDVFAVDV